MIMERVCAFVVEDVAHGLARLEWSLCFLVLAIVVTVLAHGAHGQR